MEISEVQDEKGHVYELIKGYKEGGYGRVFVVKGGRLAVKVIKRGQDRETLRRQLEFVKRLPLDELPVTRPLEMLREHHVGYVMELLSDMKPIDKLIRPDNPDTTLLKWYVQTGGLQRRLRLLARCARVLSQLHGKALIYSDLSPNNVFVSDDPAYHETWLIDVDNLQYVSSPNPRYIHTPGYGAPEVVTGKSGVNSLSDAFSLAVLIFEVLAAVHPFKGGVLVEQGDPDLEAAAQRGEIPWVDAPDDETNRSSHGIPRQYVLWPRLQKLARRTFVDGLHDPRLRPKPSEWADHLEMAADATIKCPACASTFYRRNTACPWCQQPRPDYLQLNIHVCWPGVHDCLPEEDKDKNKDVNETIASLTAVISDTPTQIMIPNRIVTGRYDRFADQPVVEVIAGKREIHVRLLDDREFFMVSEDGQRIEQLTHRAVHFPYRWRLHMGRLDQLHRVVRFTESWRKQ